MRDIDYWPVAEAAERLRRRRKERREALVEHRERAQAWARALAQDLGAADDTVRRIIGFGSTFEIWRHFRTDSDIDLAIEGGDWFFLMRRIPPGEFEVSLVELEQQGVEFAEHVRAVGAILYERS